MSSGSGTPVPPVEHPIVAADDEGIVADVVDTLVDGVRGYRTAADAVEDPTLADVMQSLADSRHDVTERVVRAASDHGYAISADLDGTAAGGLHRAWIEVEGSVAGDTSIVKSAIAGEKHALEESEEALGAGIAEPIAAAVREAAADIRSAMDRLETYVS